MTARDFLFCQLKAENKYFGNKEAWLSAVCDRWMDDRSTSKPLYVTMTSIVGPKNLKKYRILDVSSGCGTFVFYGLINGFDVYGIEPEKWKHDFNFLKAKEKDYPSSWMKRFSYAVGENLPFKDETFDVISTYQTLEHVQCHNKCFGEFKRVLKTGGYLFIRCPDYTSFFEGHYHVPMLPLMNRTLFRTYLRILNKPTKGLDFINYITKNRILGYLENDYTVIDIPLIQTKSRIYNKIKVDSNLLSRAYLTYSQFKFIFRQENNVNLAARKK